MGPFNSLLHDIKQYNTYYIHIAWPKLDPILQESKMCLRTLWKPNYLQGNMLANRFFTLLKGCFATLREAVGTDPRDWKEIKQWSYFQIMNNFVCSTCLYLVLNLKASVSFCMHLLHMISETGDTDWFHSISHCWLRNQNITIEWMLVWYRYFLENGELSPVIISVWLMNTTEPSLHVVVVINMTCGPTHNMV